MTVKGHARSSAC